MAIIYLYLRLVVNGLMKKNVTMLNIYIKKRKTFPTYIYLVIVLICNN